MKERVVVWGAAGHARVIRECLSYSGASLIALFDNRDGVASPFSDVPIYYGQSGFKHWLESHDAAAVRSVTAIGGNRGVDRCEIQRQLSESGLHPMTVIHPTAFVASSARLGRGAQILAQSAVCVDVSMAEACIINTAASVDHECELGRGVHICPGARLAGCVVVEDFATVGTGATILPRVRIGRGAHVGAGAVVTKDVAPGAVVVGSPARVLQK